MCNEGVEVAVAVEQRVIRFNAAGGDQRVYCLAIVMPRSRSARSLRAACIAMS